MFDSVLIANRGEIAQRVARTCREMGIRTVAVYSTADRDSAAMLLADKTVQIGPSGAKRSYLSIPAIIEAALQTGCDAIHPGYGFLSENPDFPEVCEANGITFIGPAPEILAHLGDKANARRIMVATELPVLDGSEEPVADLPSARDVAGLIGYPVILKAVAGGGGRGMQIVHGPEEFSAAYRETCANAAKLFGDPRLYVERYVENARHIEVQVLCDKYGNGVHLGARDCSVQRRQQKLIEETQPPGLDWDLLQWICEQSVRSALASGFTGAGTFEFLFDGKSFYFIEINCRIQVEHPVTEMVTGIDLVKEQLRVAAGAPLSFSQDTVRLNGASIQCRVNAEDPQRDFTPTPGQLTDFHTPSGPFTRVDTHAYPGWRIPSEYDSLLAKVVVWAPDRATAINRMDRALSEFRVDGLGVVTTIELLREVLARQEFKDAKHSTALLPEILPSTERG